jgi:hypothetical protein
MGHGADPVQPAPPRGDTRGAIWQKSILGTLIGLGLGLANYSAIISAADNVVGRMLALIAAGAISSAAQGAFLRAYTRPPLRWLGASVAGWLIADALLAALAPPRYALSDGPLPLMLAGLVISFPQYLMLRRHIDRAWAWVLLTLFCWALFSGALAAIF